MGRNLNFYLTIFHVLGVGGYTCTCNVPYFMNAPSLGQVHFLNPHTIFFLLLAGINIDSCTNAYNIR